MGQQYPHQYGNFLPTHEPLQFSFPAPQTRDQQRARLHAEAMGAAQGVPPHVSSSTAMAAGLVPLPPAAAAELQMQLVHEQNAQRHAELARQATSGRSPPRFIPPAQSYAQSWDRNAANPTASGHTASLAQQVLQAQHAQHAHRAQYLLGREQGLVQRSAVQQQQQLQGTGPGSDQGLVTGAIGSYREPLLSFGHEQVPVQPPMTTGQQQQQWHSRLPAELSSQPMTPQHQVISCGQRMCSKLSLQCSLGSCFLSFNPKP